MNEIKYFPVFILLARQVHQLFSEKNWKMRTDLAVNEEYTTIYVEQRA